jgi:hypothetical protein
MIRDIKIKAVLNGFIVECGCQTLVCEDVDRLTESINTYLKNPDIVEKEWVNKSINSKHTSPPTICATPPTERPQAEVTMERLNANRPTQPGLMENSGGCGTFAVESRRR